MHSLRVCLCCFGLVALGSARELASERYTVILMPDRQYSARAVGEMEREAAGILKRSGISLRVHIGYTPEEFEGGLVVVKLGGHCDADSRPSVIQNGPLGWTHSSNGTLLPFAELACDTIRGAVETALSGLDSSQSNLLLGRAMGRVLAHELYHIAGETFKHGRDGVAQPGLTVEELTTRHLELDRGDVETIRNNLPATR